MNEVDGPPGGTIDADLRYRRRVELLEADVNDELVALDPHRGTCYGFNGVATEVWRKLKNPKNLKELRAELLTEYDVTPEQCAEDLQALLVDLQQRGLIEAELEQVSR